jgi:hypothetical protein
MAHLLQVFSAASAAFSDAIGAGAQTLTGGPVSPDCKLYAAAQTTGAYPGMRRLTVRFQDVAA